MISQICSNKLCSQLLFSSCNSLGSAFFLHHFISAHVTECDMWLNTLLLPVFLFFYMIFVYYLQFTVQYHLTLTNVKLHTKTLQIPLVLDEINSWCHCSFSKLKEMTQLIFLGIRICLFLAPFAEWRRRIGNTLTLQECGHDDLKNKWGFNLHFSVWLLLGIIIILIWTVLI